MTDWFNITDTINIFEIIGLMASIVGLMFSLSLASAAKRDVRVLRGNNVNGLAMKVARNALHREASRLVSQVLFTILVASLMTIPSAFGPVSVFNTSLIATLSILTTYRGMIAYNIRRELLDRLISEES